MKRCSACLAEKESSGFYSCVGQKDGLQSRCIQCCKHSAAAWNRSHKDLRNSRRRKPPREKQTRDQLLAKKREQESARYAANRERIKNRVALWKKTKGRASVRANNALRDASKLKATPRWANLRQIADIYEQARFIAGSHVDHIVPLRHPLVCGLHVEHNLRVIPARENCSKQNRYWPDMP